MTFRVNEFRENGTIVSRVQGILKLVVMDPPNTRRHWVPDPMLQTLPSAPAHHVRPLLGTSTQTPDSTKKAGGIFKHVTYLSWQPLMRE